MREHIEPFRRGDIIKAEPLEKLAKISRRLSQVVGGENLKTRSTGHSTSISAPPRFLQGPMEVVKLADPNRPGHDEDEASATYQVRPVVHVNGQWVIDSTAGPYPLDASLSGLRLAIGDRLNAYWHYARQVFLPLAGGARQAYECRTYADFQNLEGTYVPSYSIENGASGSRGLPPLIFANSYAVTPWVQFELQKSYGPSDGEDAQNPDTWQWKRVNGRTFFVPVPVGISMGPSDWYEQVASGTGIYTGIAKKGKNYFRLRFYGPGTATSYTLSVKQSGIRMRLVGLPANEQTDEIGDEGFNPTVDESVRFGSSPSLFIEQSVDNITKDNDEDIERYGGCPFFQPYGPLGKVVEVVVPEPPAVREALQEAIDEDYAIEDDNGDVVLDDDGNTLQTAEQVAASEALQNVYYSEYALAIEVWVTVYGWVTDPHSDDSCGCSEDSSPSSPSSPSSQSGENSSSSSRSSSSSWSSQSSQSLSSSSSNSPSSPSSQSFGFSDLSSMSSSS